MFKRTCPWWLRQYYLRTFKTRSDIGLLPHHTLCKSLLVDPGSAEGGGGRHVKPLRIRCEFSKCLVKPPAGQARLSARYGQTDLRAACHLISLHRDTHARHKWQTVHLNVPVRSSIAISLTHSMKTDDDSRIGKYGCDQLNLIFMSLSLLSSWLILNGSALITSPYNLLRFKWKVNLKFKESLFQRLFSSMMKFAMMSAYNNILTLSQSSSPCFIFVVFRH